MKKKLIITLLCVSLFASMLTACGSSPKTKTSKKETVSVEKEDEPIKENVTEEDTAEIAVKTREELISEKEFSESYISLHGYWVNDDVTYYFGSFVQDGILTNFYTKTDEPDNWYSYEIISQENILDFDYNEQFVNDRLSVVSYDSSGTTKEIEFNILTDWYSEKKHIDIVDGENVTNMTKLSNYSSELIGEFNYLSFVDLKVDENGNVILSPIDIRNVTLQAIVENDGHEDVYFCSDNSDGYYAFVKDEYSYIYDGYYEEAGFKDAYPFYGVSVYPWTYEIVKNPYLEVGNEIFEAIPLSEDILSGYTYRISEDKMLTYNGVEGMYLKEYSLGQELHMYFNYIDTDSCIELLTCEKFVLDELKSGERKTGQATNLEFLDGIIKGDDFVVCYDPAQKTKMIAVYFEKEGIAFNFGFESDDLENKYENAVLEARRVFDSLSIPNGEQTIDEHLKDTIDFGGWKFADDVHFNYINRGEKSVYGLESISDSNMSFVLELEKKFNVHNVQNDDVYIFEEVYETEFDDSFEVLIGRNKTTHSYDRLYAHVPNKMNEYIYIQGEDFFEYDKEFSEIEEESKNYILNKLRSVLVSRE